MLKDVAEDRGFRVEKLIRTRGAAIAHRDERHLAQPFDKFRVVAKVPLPVLANVPYLVLALAVVRRVDGRKHKPPEHLRLRKHLNAEIEVDAHEFLLVLEEARIVLRIKEPAARAGWENKAPAVEADELAGVDASLKHRKPLQVRLLRIGKLSACIEKSQQLLSLRDAQAFTRGV